jgi:hypothetical protein
VVPVHFSEQKEQEACAHRPEWAKHKNGPFMRNNPRASESCKCGQGWQSPYEAVQNSVLWCAMIYAVFLQVHTMMQLFRALRMCTTHKKVVTGQQGVPN